MPSNLPPLAQEEVVLRARRQALLEDLARIRDEITQIEDTIASAYRSIDMLMQPSAKARETLNFYQKYHPHASILEKPHGISIDEPRVAVMPLCGTLRPHVGTEILEKIRLLGCEGAMTDEYNGQSQADMNALGNNLRRQRLILNVNSTSLKLYFLIEIDLLSGLKEINNALSTVKCVPDEIWYQILGTRISGDSYRWPEYKDKPLTLAALPYSHVCRAWRRVVISSPSMWKYLHWNLPPNTNANRNLLDLWIRRSENARLQIWERQMYSGIATAGVVCTTLNLPTPKNLEYFLHQTRRSPPYNMDCDTDSEIDAHHLVLRASISSTRMPTLQHRLVRRFTSLESLNMDNTLPERMPRILTLRHLRVSFSVHHNVYPLGNILENVPNLQTLQLRHYSQDWVPTLRKNIELPNLKELAITPLEGVLIESLTLPSLRSLSISTIRNQNVVMGDTWLNELTPHCANLTSLTLKCNGEDAQNALLDRLHILSTIRSSAPKLRKVTISDGHLLGTALAESLEMDEQRYCRIERLTIDGCIGVSRMDCERIVLLVNKLDVYRTVHGASKFA